MTSIRNQDDRRRVLAAYHGQPVAVQLFLHLRWALTFFQIFSKYLPKEGRIFDVGCGHGLFPLLLALTSADRTLIGYDPDARRIAIAQTAATGTNNITYTTTWPELRSESLAAVTCLDMLYLLTPAEKERLLTNIGHWLVPGGIVLLKINGQHPRWKFALTYLEEWLMTQLGPTRASERLHFWSVDRYRTLVHKAGFEVIVDQRLGWWLPQTHHLLVARRPEVVSRSA